MWRGSFLAAVVSIVINIQAGNVLAVAVCVRATATNSSNNNLILQYTQSGQNIGSLPLPDSPYGSGQAKDIVIDKNGAIQNFNGWPFKSLATYEGSSWTYRAVPDWGLLGVTYYGAVAAYQDYVYAQCQSSDGLRNGIIRFDTANNYTTKLYQIPHPTDAGRFLEPQDVTMGMDGWLYVTVDQFTTSGNRVYQLNPITMQVSKYIQLETGTRDGDSAVVDADGNLYVMGFGQLNKYSPSGQWLKSVPLSGHNDIDISSDGRILAAQSADAVILNTDLEQLFRFTTQGTVYGKVFLSWDTYQTPVYVVPEPSGILVLAGMGVLLLRRTPFRGSRSNVQSIGASSK